MATSGTYTFNPANSDLVLEAFERIGKRANQLDISMLSSAARSANFVLTRWANKGINLWEVDLQSVALVQGTATYALATETIQVISVYINSGSPATDRVLYPIGRDDYAAIPDKTAQAFPNSYWFQRTNTPSLTLWQVPDGNGPYTLYYYRMKRMQDLAASMAQTADVNYRFLDAFCADLACALSVKYAPERYQMLQGLALAALSEARGEDRELAPISFIPDLSSYYNN